MLFSLFLTKFPEKNSRRKGETVKYFTTGKRKENETTDFFFFNKDFYSEINWTSVCFIITYPSVYNFQLKSELNNNTGRPQ